MSNFSLKEAAKRDFLTSLGLWAAIEVISFGICPAIGIVRPEERFRLWFSWSIPLGIGGAFLIALSSQLMADNYTQAPSNNRVFMTWVAQIGGWLGIVGILFPFMMVSTEFLAQSFEQIYKQQSK